VESTPNQPATLSANHKRHLLVSYQYADKLLSEVEEILMASQSKSPFPQYKNSLTLAQTKVVQDYIARIRSQMIHALASQNITPPAPERDSAHAIKVTLEFADIAFDECRSDQMRGYGAIPASLVPELDGMADEMRGLVRKLISYLSQGLGQALEARLRRLEGTLDEISLLQKLERIINAHGLVEFRSPLAVILDRLENTSFQIAMFGRVSSGKSSLLNYILQTDVLPVGVNPITAVPTRIVHGDQPRLLVAYIDNKREALPIGRLSELVSEKFNPGNSRNVARIVVEIPSTRLRDGVVFVDTPGLGSLAVSGARETLAYLPQCDLGVLLVDAGSTLTEEDLSTLQALYEAAIPAQVLLSKADLLAPEDRDRSLAYIGSQIRSFLGLEISVHPVSTESKCAYLTDGWFREQILPLYERHQELARQSVRRKIGALREAVAAALKTRISLSGKELQKEGKDRKRLKAIETRLRKATAKIEETRSACFQITDQVRDLAPFAISRAATAVAEIWSKGESAPGRAEETVVSSISEVGAYEGKQISEAIGSLAALMATALQEAGHVLNLESIPDEDELRSVIKEMPRLDLGGLSLKLRPASLRFLGKGFIKWRVEGQLREAAEAPLREAFQAYARSLEAWMRRSVAELQRRFDEHADAIRAQLAQSGSLPEQGGTSAGEREAIQRDIELLTEEAPVSTRDG
jgi:GTP-binding protein EngB required for normal cell division